MTPPATAATTSNTRPGSVSWSRSLPTPNNAPYTSTQPATQSIRFARPSADGRTSGARAATGPQPAREGRVRREKATRGGSAFGGGGDGEAHPTPRVSAPGVRTTYAKVRGP